MRLITKTQRRAMLNNAATPGPHRPVVKLFTPWQAWTWLLSELDPDQPDLAFGLCDLGFGYPELGSVSLAELAAIQGPAGLRVERDRYFAAAKTIDEYADAAREAGYIAA